MKRVLAVLMCVVMIGGFAGCDGGNNGGKSDGNDYTDIYNYGDEYFRSIGKRATFDFDSPNYLYNDFSDGIDSRFSMVDAVWGNNGRENSFGMRSDNIFLTTDGYLAIRVNGDYYRGDAVGTTNGIRTGGTLVSDHDMGPGRFEVRMKAAPRDGTCTAMWTYQYDSGDPSVNGWNEIDIEILGGGDNGGLDTTMYTTWQSADRANTEVVKHENIRLSDDQFHIHTFDWYTDYNGTGKERVDWFIDGNLVRWTDKAVALKSGNLWLGAYRPSGGFGGVSNFESTYMVADWIRYTPFLGMDGWKETGYKNGYNNYNKKFPTERITLTDEMLNQRLANTGFENVDTAATAPTEPVAANYKDYAAVGWKKAKILESECAYEIVNDVKSGSKALKVTGGAVEQDIDNVFEGFKFDLSCWGKKATGENGKIIIRFYEKNGSIISDETINITSSEYEKYQKSLTAPANCGKMRISIRSGILDDITCTFKGL